MSLTPALVGAAMALAVGAYARMVGFDRDRSFYPVVMTVIASYYVLFAVMADGAGLAHELVGAALFMAVAAIGFRVNLWLVVAALAAHGIFDVFHHAMIENPGVPAWWPGWCLGYDVAAAAWLALVIVKGGLDPNGRSGRHGV